MSTQLVISVKTIIGLLSTLLAFIVTNGALVIPLLPPSWSHAIGSVVAFAGALLALFGGKPTVFVTPATATAPASVKVG